MYNIGDAMPLGVLRLTTETPVSIGNIMLNKLTSRTPPTTVFSFIIYISIAKDEKILSYVRD